MRALLLAVILLPALSSQAQYYYKDILGTRESSDLIKSYMKNKVNQVVVNSFDGSDQKDDQFYVEQQFSPASLSLKTTTRSGMTDQSILVSYVDASGNVIKTVDSSDEVVNITSYNYDANGRLVTVNSSSADTSGLSNEGEQHIWQWAADGKPSRMLRIKNKVDTTYVDFKFDENGNVSEERQTRRGVSTPPVYYYYNANRQLTDIVRYNMKANRLLPEYMFEYNQNGQLAQKITVPANNTQYLIWRYQYNAQGLRTKEVIYDKQKKLTGKVEYQYSFGS